MPSNTAIRPHRSGHRGGNEQRDLWKVHCYQLLSKLKKKRHRNSSQNDVIWCYFVLACCAFVLTQCIEKDIAFGCCLIGSLPVSRLMWRSLNASVYMWSELRRAPLMTKWLGVSKQPTNRPVLSSTGSWEQQRRCLVSSHLNHIWWCAQLRAGRLFWFQPVWHICCLSRCIVPIWELGATGANAPLILLSVCTNRACAYKQASMVHIMWKVRRPCETLCAPAWLVSRALSCSANVWRVGCWIGVLHDKRMHYLLINLVWNRSGSRR